ncbi:MAG: glycosyltransferase [Candidatus Omnitrophica bacterium]|nr:glycosyltransferase [Candidatus Omnitrophota bacterium]
MSARQPRTLVLLTLNEIEGITALHDRIPYDCADEVFVVDGGSRDGTRGFFIGHGIRVLDQKSKGRGEAFRLAVQEALHDHILFFSPDGNEDPADIPKLFDLLDEGADIAIARRFGPGAHNEEDDQTFRWRAWTNRAFTLAVNLVWNRGSYVYDTINGFRAFKRSSFEKLKVDGPGFVIEFQSTIRALKQGMKIREIPTYEGARIGGESTAKSLPTGVLFVRHFIRELLIGKRFSRGPDTGGSH